MLNLFNYYSILHFYTNQKIRELILELVNGQLGKIILLLKWTAISVIRWGHIEVIIKEGLLN